MIRRVLPFAVLLAVSAFAPGKAEAIECTAAMLKASAKYEQSMLGCTSKLLLKGDAAAHATCISKATDAYQTAFSKIGACGGTADVCDGIAASCLGAVAQSLPGSVGDKCTSKKLKAAGKFAAAQLGCYAKAADKLVAVDSACLGKAAGKFETAIAKAGACADGGALQSLVLGSCVSPVVTVDVSNSVAGACLPVDECAAGTDDCHADATCTDQPYRYLCTCNVGFAGDGVSCSNIDECNEGSDDCDANAACVDTSGSFDCLCNAGFSGDGVTCSDIDECVAGTDDCVPFSTCINTSGGFTCSDIDQCAAGTDNCDGNATCTDTPAGFSCTCNVGYGGDGVTCEPLLSCPCWQEHTLASLAAALENGAAYPAKTCTSGPLMGQAEVTAETVPYNAATVASIYTTVAPNPLNGCCAYVDGSPRGCAPFLSTPVVEQCGAEIVSVMPLVSWCP